jgi:hypothetical protein
VGIEGVGSNEELARDFFGNIGPKSRLSKRLGNPG